MTTNLHTWEIKALAKGGGLKSRKLWAFIITVGAGIALAWEGKLHGEEFAMLVSLFTVYCCGNLVAKQIVMSNTLRALFTSASAPTQAATEPVAATTMAPVSAPISAASSQQPPAEEEAIERPELVQSAEIAELKRENERLKEQLLRRAELDTLKWKHEQWKEKMRRSEIDDLVKENEELRDRLITRMRKLEDLD